MDIKGQRVALHNLGCKVNSYEAEAMLKCLRDAGAEVVDWDSAADIYIINTCSVTNIADRKSRQMLHRARRKNPVAVVVAAGCYVQARAEELRLDTEVDILLGNNKKSKIVDILRDFKGREEHGEYSFVSDMDRECSYESMEISEREDKGRAFIKVQDGCNQFCSYCIIPYVRGRIRSRSEEDTLNEVRVLVSRGYREMVLTGIHLSSYGLDLSSQSYEYAVRNNTSDGLLSLIRAVASVPGVERVRLGSLEPRVITDSFVEGLSGIKELCCHFHLSLQSGSDKILRAMNRHYSTEDFRSAVKRLRKAFPMAAVTTDVIVGFPGETEEEFERSYKFIAEMDFYEMHVFKYSERRGTSACGMPGQVSEQLKTERSGRLISLDEENSRRFRERFKAREESVLIEELISEDGEKYLCGMNPQYVRFRIPAKYFSEPTGQIGEIIPVLSEKICKTYVLAKPQQIR